MITSKDTLLYISHTTGKPVVVVHNTFEDQIYFFLADSFTPANPSNHIHTNSLEGRDLAGLMQSLIGYSHRFDTSSETAVLTKINELPLEKYMWSGPNWVKLQ